MSVSRHLGRKELARWAAALQAGRTLFPPLGEPARIKVVQLPSDSLRDAAEGRRTTGAEILRQLLFPLRLRRASLHPGIPRCGQVQVVGDRLIFEEAAIEAEAGSRASRPGRLAELLRGTEIVAAAHEARILHLDLKPEHLCSAADGTTYILDWDSALPWPAGQRRRYFGFCGTPQHMAPEQTHGDFARLSPATDVFGLGLLLFAILHDAPARRLQPSYSDHMAQARNEPIRCTARAIARFPSLCAVVERATRPDPEHRYETAKQFGSALAQAVEADAMSLRPGDRKAVADRSTSSGKSRPSVSSPG